MRTAAAGAVVWLVALVAAVGIGGRDVLLDALLMLAPLVVVPLAVHLARQPRHDGTLSLPHRLAERACVPAAALVAVAVVAPRTGDAPHLVHGALVVPWLIVTVLIAVAGVVRLADRGRAPWAEVVVDAGMVFTAIGGVWLAVDRLDVAFLGFGGVIATLTAVHFHYAALALAVLAGQSLRSTGGPVVTATAVVGYLVGIPAVALGITIGGPAELPATIWLTAGVLAVAIAQWRAAARVHTTPGSGTARLGAVGLRISSVSLTVGMGLAVAYATGQALPAWSGLAIPFMIATHGVVNGIGGVLVGLLSWSLLSAAAAPDGRPTSGPPTPHTTRT